MKLPILTLALLFVATALSAAVENGSTAPEFSLKTAEGKEVSLKDFQGKTVVLEWVNPGCPFVRKFYDVGAMQKFQTKAKEMDVVWLSINSTNPGHRDYMDAATTIEWNKENNVASTWLMDEDGMVGKAYGARTTPHMFIISGEGKVVYQGAIDSIRDAKSKSINKADNYVLMALKEIAADSAISEERTSPYGCSVKYKK